MKQDKEKEKLYGQLVFDFVNAETSDKACFGLLKNAQEAFNFFPKFTDQAKKIFPSLNPFTSLPKHEKILLKLFVAEKRLLGIVAETINLDSMVNRLINYDPQKETLIYREIYPRGPMPDDIEISRQMEASIDEFQDHKRHIYESYFEQHYPESDMWKLKGVKSLMNVGRAILKHKKFVSKSKYSKIKDLSETYPDILSGHIRIQKHQRVLRRILKDITIGRTISEINDFQPLLQDYNNFYRVELRLSSDDFFINKQIFLKEIDFISLNVSKEHRNGRWVEPYRIATIFCLIDFFKSLKNREWEKLKECPYCQIIFMANDIKRKRCYSNACRKEYERLKKQKQREEDPVKYI